MKKKYLKPTMVVIKLRSSQTLLAGSAGSAKFILGGAAPESASDYDDVDGELQ